MDEDEENEEYVACSNCGEVFSKRYTFCPYCGRRVFHPHTTPILLIFRRNILLKCDPSVHLFFTLPFIYCDARVNSSNLSWFRSKICRIFRSNVIGSQYNLFNLFSCTIPKPYLCNNIDNHSSGRVLSNHP
ncbi:MAG: zinc ribbon domain-containing protein [Candidatus Bathyarchaeales archaeon]